MMESKRDKAYELLTKHVANQKTIAHCLASEAVLKSLATKLGEDQEKWGMAGLVHDIDMELTNGDPAVHGLKSGELLTELDLEAEVLEAIRMHNESAVSEKRSTRFQHALAAGETITGLIYATALVYPDKKLSSVKYKSVRKRMKEKAFAASVDRSIILECELIGIPLDEFIQLAVDAMNEIAKDIGL